jgi:hypothetical protein
VISLHLLDRLELNHGAVATKHRHWESKHIQALGVLAIASVTTTVRVGVDRIAILVNLATSLSLSLSGVVVVFSSLPYRRPPKKRCTLVLPDAATDARGGYKWVVLAIVIALTITHHVVKRWYRQQRRDVCDTVAATAMLPHAPDVKLGAMTTQTRCSRLKPRAVVDA